MNPDLTDIKEKISVMQTLPQLQAGKALATRETKIEPVSCFEIQNAIRAFKALPPTQASMHPIQLLTPLSKSCMKIIIAVLLIAPHYTHKKEKDKLSHNFESSTLYLLSYFMFMSLCELCDLLQFSRHKILEDAYLNQFLKEILLCLNFMKCFIKIQTLALNLFSMQLIIIFFFLMLILEKKYNVQAIERYCTLLHSFLEI